MESEKKSGFPKKRLLVFFIAIALLAYSFSLIDMEKFFVVVTNADFWWLLLVYPLAFVSIMLKSLKFKKVLNMLGADYPLTELAKIFAIGFFIGALTPGRIGDFSRAAYIKDKVPIIKGGLAVYIDRAIDVFVLLSFSAASIAVLSIFFGINVFPIELAVLLIAILVVFSLVMFNLKKAETISRFFFSFVPQKFKKLVSIAYSKYNEAAMLVKSDYASLLLPLFIGFVAWSVNFVIGLAILAAYSVNVPVYAVFLLMPVIILTDLLPFTFSGIGTREIVAILLLSVFGVPPEKAVAFSITFFIMMYPVLVLIGFYYSLKKKAVVPWKSQVNSDGNE